jgi:hypothetical protein
MGTGGMAGGSGGMAGSGGMGGSGGAVGMNPCTAAGDCSAVLKMDGAMNIDPPASRTGSDGIQGPSGIDGVPGPTCVVTEQNATHGNPFKEWHWQLMGAGITMGTPYKVTFHTTGVLECKTYQNLNKCTRPANAGRAATYDMWCPEATDPPLTVPGDHYNTVMLSVTPTKSTSTPNIGPMNGPLPAVGNWWMLNQCPVGVNEGHLTWKVDYEKTITVPGGSWVNFVEFDTNCREIVNCGPSTDAGVVCTEQFSIKPPATASPAPPAAISTQPAAAGGGAFGQWVYFDVVSIVP